MNWSRSFLLLLFGFFGSVQGAPEQMVSDGVTYHFVRAKANLVRILWKDGAGAKIRTFPRAAKYLAAQNLSVDTLMNGGIFEPGAIPSGLLVQEGRELRPVNRRDGEGNFFLKPNGIFLLSAERAAVIATDEYPVKEFDARAAVQSGPLLLRRGKIHPRFNPESQSRLHRNGVGVTKAGDVIFVMSNFNSPKFPNLYEFAELFKSLGCDDALFLDGDLSQMRSGADVNRPSNRFASIIAVVAPPKSKIER